MKKLTPDQRKMRVLLAKVDAKTLANALGYKSTRPLYAFAKGRTHKLAGPHRDLFNQISVPEPKRTPSVNKARAKQRVYAKTRRAGEYKFPKNISLPEPPKPPEKTGVIPITITRITAEEFIDLLDFRPGTTREDFTRRIHNYGVEYFFWFNNLPAGYPNIFYGPVSGKQPDLNNLRLVAWIVEFHPTNKRGTTQFLIIPAGAYGPVESRATGYEYFNLMQKQIEADDDELYDRQNDDDYPYRENFLDRQRDRILGMIVA